MNQKEIKKLIELVENSSIGELEVSRWGKKVRISKTPTGAYPAALPSVTLPPDRSPSIPVQVPRVSEVSQSGLPKVEPIVQSVAGVPPAEEKESDVMEIKSPMVGTFYRAPSPESDSYVNAGDVITPGKVLCIIEAMKLMNEIESEINGRITKIMVENGKPVEYNQVLFQVEKN